MAHALSIASPSRTARIVLWLDRVSGRPWFLPAVSAFPLCDYVAPVLPNQVLLLALTVLHPRRSDKLLEGDLGVGRNPQEEGLVTPVA